MFKFPLAYNTFSKNDEKLISKVFRDGFLTQGKITKNYELKLSKFFNSKFAVAVNSGSSANLLMISALIYSKNKALKLKRGDEVIVPAVSWMTTYSPLIQLGLVPKIVDIEKETLNISIESIKNAINEKTKCIFAVNLLGHPCEFKELLDICNKHDLILLEDNCESMGAKYASKYTGTFGLMSSQSTYMSHHISTIEGGFVLTDDEYFRDLLVSLRSHGWARDIKKNSKLYTENITDKNFEYLPDDFLFLLPGFNLRTTEINSQLGISQLPKLNEIISVKRNISGEFSRILDKYKNLFSTQIDKYFSSCFGFPIIAKNKGDKDLLKIELEKNGFQTRPIVTGNILSHPVSKFFPGEISKLKNSTLVHENGIFIGNYFQKATEAVKAFENSFNLFS